MANYQIYVIRHAAKSWSDSGLSDHGKEQARAISVNSFYRGVTQIFAVGIRRVQETVNPLAFSKDLTIYNVGRIGSKTIESLVKNGAAPSNGFPLVNGEIVLIAGRPEEVRNIGRWAGQFSDDERFGLVDLSGDTAGFAFTVEGDRITAVEPIPRVEDLDTPISIVSVHSIDGGFVRLTDGEHDYTLKIKRDVPASLRDCLTKGTMVRFSRMVPPLFELAEPPAPKHHRGFPIELGGFGHSGLVI